jgi:serine/threonine protein kinase
MQSKYRLIDKIATGGMAEIFLARSTVATGLGKFVAIKKILPEFSQHPDFVDMFKTEARIAMQMQHKNLVSILDVGFENGQCYLVMELVPGLNLRQVLKTLYANHKRVPAAIAIQIAADAAMGLEHAHKSTIHRDVSPANIMITFQGEVKVIDFGVAKAINFDHHTKTGIIKGKLNYMSPEQIAGKSLDHRSDIFSLGLVLYEILAQRKVFLGASEADIVREMQNQEVPSLQELNPLVDGELAEIVHRALRLDPKERYLSMEDLSRALRNYLSEKFPSFQPVDVGTFMKREFAAENQEMQDLLFGLTTPRSARYNPEEVSLALFRNLPAPVLEPLRKNKTPINAVSVETVTQSIGLVSRKIRKKFHIRYAHQVNPELNAIYEMNTLHGSTKRGDVC